MLELQETSFSILKDGEKVDLIHKASLQVPRGHFMAIVGPSGCGKTTLLKVIAGILAESEGSIYWDGRDLAEDGDFEPAEIGYVPQFSIASEHLTVEESVENAVLLRVRTASREEVYALADQVLDQTGLDAVRENRVKVLSGGQKRRLGLALELVSNPLLLLCDEVTSGLDPKSEREIVHLLHRLSQHHQQQRIVINVTHSLSNLALYDSVLVLHEGKIVYHGRPDALNHYFSVVEAEEIYPILGKRASLDWHDSWIKHRDPYYANFPDSMIGSPKVKSREEAHDRSQVQLPGALAQFMVLQARRWKVFFRDRVHLILTLAIFFGFPALVVIFASEGIEPIQRLSETINENPNIEAERQAEFFRNQLTTGGLVSGLVMFQVILLTLMAANNSAREIAGERLIFEKEKLAGLRPISYLAGKIGFLAVLVCAQSLWMVVFVESFCRIPGDFIAHCLLLVLVNAAMTSVCLGISSLMRSPDQASLLSIYLVGFQLPLSGAVLALPDRIEPFTRPFISAYWGWSGIMRSLEPAFLDAVKKVTSTTLESPGICAFVLLLHVLAGLFLAYVGTHRSRWD